jgi:signal transduction histidine kinase
LLATLEVCRTRSRSENDYEATIDKAIDQLTRLHSLMENLLLLARADAGQIKVNRTTLDLVALVEEAWLPLDPRAQEKRLQVSMHIPDKCGVLCDAHVLRIVLTNLLDNAVSYADAGGSVSIRLSILGAHASMEISNTGSQLKPQDPSRVFERFWRGDSSRSHTGRHAGLGLSLSQRLLAITGDTISVESTKDGLFVARVELKGSDNGTIAAHGRGVRPVIVNS